MQIIDWGTWGRMFLRKLSVWLRTVNFSMVQEWPNFLESETLHLKHIETDTVPLCSSWKPFPWSAASFIAHPSLHHWGESIKHQSCVAGSPVNQGAPSFRLQKQSALSAFVSWRDSHGSPKILFACSGPGAGTRFLAVECLTTFQVPT